MFRTMKFNLDKLFSFTDLIIMKFKEFKLFSSAECGVNSSEYEQYLGTKDVTV